MGFLRETMCEYRGAIPILWYPQFYGVCPRSILFKSRQYPFDYPRRFPIALSDSLKFVAPLAKKFSRLLCLVRPLHPAVTRVTSRSNGTIHEPVPDLARLYCPLVELSGVALRFGLPAAEAGITS